MKVYIVKDEDVERLLAMIDRNPKHGYGGGSSQILTDEERKVHDLAHRFFNYQVRTWLSSIGS